MHLLRVAAVVVFLIGGLSAGPARAQSKILYNRDIRPILAEACFACHGPDSAARKADLRLDQREAALAMASIVPGKPDDSEMIRRIFSTDADEVMPPPKSHKVLKPEQRELLKRWVAAGAEYQPHWSFIAPARPPVPKVKSEAWVRNPIDAFILAELEEQGLKPADEADARTLARRLSLDLTGLPPEPADVEAFVADKAPDAYEKYVDKLMSSPRWGEHRGRYWLDVARYADTHGIHFDNFREMWSYRDWVIAAFNANQPFDRFTIEQLAGDLLPQATLEQKIGSGFNRCNITTNEGGIIDEEYLVLYARDRTETTSQVWMGLTAGCAVCHDHKFDPLSQREFYEMAAFFNNTTQAAKDGNIKDTPPILVVPTKDDRPRWDALVKEIDTTKQHLAARKSAARPDFDKWLATATPGKLAAQTPHEAMCFHLPLNEGAGAVLHAAEDGQAVIYEQPKAVSWVDGGKTSSKSFRSSEQATVAFDTPGDFDHDQPFSCSVWVNMFRNAQDGPIVARMDEGNGIRGWDLWLEGGKPGMHLIHAWDKSAIKVTSKTGLKAGDWQHLTLTYDGKGKAAGVKLYLDGVPLEVNVVKDTLAGTTRTTAPFKLARRHGNAANKNIQIQDVRLYRKSLSPSEAIALPRVTRAAWLASKPKDKRPAAETNELFDWWLPQSDGPTASLAQQLATLEREQTSLKNRGTVAHVMNEKTEPAIAYILNRGEYDQRKDKVNAKTPAVLPPMPEDLPRNRLGFAQWLLRPQHPLTARVTVNRFWQELFGTGLVRTAGDFGVSGEPPSHPELLDWLAVEFRESGWDVKRFFKLMVTSAAYRQSAATTKLKLEKDPANRLVSRGPRFRMDAEMVRDYALAASGLLSAKIGGPSVKPYQADGVWEAVAMIGSNTRDYKRDTGESLYRRSMYTLWKRSAPPATMDAFNAPSRETCTVRRERTNTPLQALVTLNDPQFVEAARHLATRTLNEGGKSTGDRIDYLVQRLLARPLRGDEQSVVESSLAELLKFYQAHPDDAKKLITFGESKPDEKLDAGVLAAWTMLCNELMNLDEVLNK